MGRGSFFFLLERGNLNGSLYITSKGKKVNIPSPRFALTNNGNVYDLGDVSISPRESSLFFLTVFLKLFYNFNNDRPWNRINRR